ncbi:MAG TPA: hypothetical protein VN037_11325 [Verrucomicrobiae bacterium]|jgi:hypothetical protein|nr:hypothetical protein [Verrucomicrobiae bacterium]
MMSRLPVSCTLAAALVAMLFALGPQSLHATPLCPFGNATLHGTYSVSGGGTVAGLGPVTSVGEVTYDGKGNSNAVYTASLNGTIVPVIVPGTYVVNPDCTATAVEANSHFNFVITPDGNTVWWMATDTHTVLSGVIIRLHPLGEFEAQVRSGNNRVGPASLRRSRKASANPRIKTAAVTQRLPRSS